MPQLPTAPPGKPGAWTKATTPTKLPDSKQGVSAAVVMHHFARGEVRNLDAQSEQLYARLIARLKERPEFSRWYDIQLREIIKAVTFKLQSADLTINFEARKYFEKENNWTSYKQMYDLAQVDVKQADGTSKREMQLRSQGANPAGSRDAADTRVTFGNNVSTPGMQGVARFMQTGGLTSTGGGAYAAVNPHFNPKARQVFTAVNYGRYPLGGAPSYGSSHFILRDGLKINAIYYPGDTFGVPDANSRTTYGMLFAVAIYSDKLLDWILNSCYRQIITRSVPEMLEAHIFEPILFAKDVKEMRISEQEVLRSTRTELLSNPPKSEEWIAATLKAIWDNARKFAKKHGIILTVV